MFVTPAYAESTPAGTAEAGHGTVTDAQGAPAVGATNTETGVAHDAGQQSGVFPPFDHTTFASQLLWLAITFGIFYIIMQKVIVPRIGGILENRHDRIAQDLDEAGRLKAEADAAIETYEKELAAAKAKANSIAATARDSAKSKADADRVLVEADLAQKLAAAEARIGDIKAKAFADVGTIAEETASEIIDQLIGTSAGKGDVAAAVAAVSGKEG